MKKLLTILGTIGLIATTNSGVVACSKTNSIDYTFENDKRTLNKKGDIVVIILTDYDSLKDAKTTSSDLDENIITVSQPSQEGKITVEAVTESGTATVTIEAQGKSSTIISFTIPEKIEIQATIDKTTLAVGEAATISILNSNDLLDLRPSSDPHDSVEFMFVNQATIKVIPKIVGQIKIALHSFNAIEDKFFDLTVGATIEIDAQLHEIFVFESVFINILNVNKLVNPDAKLSASGLTLATMDKAQIKQGKIKITALSADGELDVTITADNAQAPVDVHITISLL